MTPLGVWLSALAVCTLLAVGQTVDAGATTVIDLREQLQSQAAHRFPHFWKECVGSGHALLATRADYQRQLTQFKADLGIKRVRMHGIFDDDMSVVLSPGRYEFYNVDQIYDFLLSIGVRPIVELSFMPGLLADCSPWASSSEPCQYVMHYHGIVMPPANFSAWKNLVKAFATHLVQRYGVAEVRQWNFEVWNELWGMNYPHPYLDLYEAAREGLKEVDSKLRVGGPVTMQCQYVADFVRDEKGKYEFISTHLYPTDPNCTWPAPGYSDIDCFANTIKRAHSQVPAGTNFYLTEYNAGLFNASLLYSSYAAAFVLRNVALLYDVLDIWSYWTFSDIFEESGMHSAPFEGFNYGMQTLRGIKKPVYRAFELLNNAGNEITILNVSNDPNETLTAFVSSQPTSGNASIFLSNFAPQYFTIDDRLVNITFDSSSGSCDGVTATLYTIDDHTTNPHASWKVVGSPAYPTAAQLQDIEAHSFPAVQELPAATTPEGRCWVSFEARPYSALRLDIPLA